MIQKLTKAATRLLAILFAMFATTGAWAATDKANPVTGENQSYTYNYTGSGAWTASDWSPTPSNVPQASGSGVWDSLLIDGNLTVTAPSHVEGWSFRIGLFGGAKLTVPYIRYWNGTAYAVVDEGSKLTIKTINTQDNWNATVNYYVAAAGGVTYECAFNPTVTAAAIYNYNLKGAGSVVYENAVSSGSHVIKQADVTLSGNATPSVESKPLVSFGSGTTKAFTADAAIKVYDTDGSTLKKLVGVTAVRRSDATIANTSSALTTADAVGTCEIVQCTDGIVLYYVDGAPSAVTGYTPSININFTNGNGLTTAGEVGLSGYAVPGMSWNNFTIPNDNTEQTFSTVAAIDSTGGASTASGVSVTVSGHRGVHYCSNLDAGSNPLHGYVDEGGATGSNTATPTVTITGIPYANYRLIVYHSTDSENLPFGYDTINGTDFTYVDGVQAIGTTSWGNSGASNSANAIAEGVNTLVSGILSGSTATMVAHRVGTANSASVRGCFAAIQVVEVVVSDTELVIPVTGATTYTVDADKEYEKVIISGTGTLTLDGTGTITTDVLEIENNSAIVMNSSRLAATAVIGKGTAIYDGEVPPTDKGWTNSENWKGTVWLKGKDSITGNNNASTGVQPNSLGNVNSKVKFSGVSGWVEAPITYDPEIVLENDAYDFALKLTNGNSPANKDNNDNRSTTIKKLSGSGTLCCGGSSYAWPLLKVWDSSGFTGSINTSNPDGNAGGKTGMVVVFCNEDTSFSDTLYNLYNGYPRSIVVASGTTVTQTSGATWTTATGLLVDGTFNVNGALASSAATAVRGSGTVVFTGRAPTPTGDTWWKNSNWTGTVQIGDITDMIGRTSGYTGTYLDFNSYGNANSLVKLGNLTGWMDNYTCNVPVNLAGTLTINNGISGEVFTFKKLISSGGYITAPNQSATFSIRIEDGSEYAGYIGLNSKRVIFGTGTAPAFVKGQIYVSSDAAITVPAVNTAYWAVGGIVVEGELKADKLARFGGGTNITTSDNGVFTLTSTGNGAEGETDTDYARIRGTGSLKYEGTGWRALTTNNLLTAVTLVNEQSGDILLSRALTYTIGSLSGSKKFQGNYGSGNRYLNIVQTKDTEWSGTITADGQSRLAGFSLDATSTGTLTLSGTETQSATLALNGGAVNLTGTWVGATTVAGTFGGTGTLTGNLTFVEGSTFKAFAADDADGLVVSGTVGYPAEGTVTVDVSAIEPETDVALIKAADLDASKFALAEGTPEGYSLEVVDGVLTLTMPHVTITVPSIANTTVTVKIGDNTIGTSSGDYNVAPDSVVTVTYAAVDGYEISGTTEYTIDTSKSETTFDPAGTTEVKQYVASITAGETTTKYTTLQAAVDAAVRNSKIIVLANETDGATIPSKDISFYIYTGAFTTGEILDATGDFITTRTTEKISISDDIYADKVTAVKYSVAAAFMAVTIDGMRTLYGQADANAALTAANAGSIGTTVEFLSGDPASYAEFLPMFDYNSDTGIYTKVTDPVAAVYSGVSQLSVHRTLADAVGAAEAGLTVKLLANVSLDATVAISKTLTLDLNGYTITASGINAITTSGALTVEGSSGSVSVTLGNSVVLTSSSATLTVSGGATLSPTPTTNVAHARVKTVTEDGTTTYSLIPGTTFTVY